MNIEDLQTSLQDLQHLTFCTKIKVGGSSYYLNAIPWDPRPWRSEKPGLIKPLRNFNLSTTKALRALVLSRCKQTR